mgnify:CR=1 FL=1
MNRMQIFVYDKNTRAYNHEKCEIRLYNEKDDMISGVIGDYPWQNRTWQRYDYEKAILNALNLLNATEQTKDKVKNCNDVLEALSVLGHGTDIVMDTGEILTFTVF